MKSNNFYENHVESNEFIIALLILIFLIFVPTPTFIGGILVWVVVFIILRQITKRVDLALFLSFGFIILLFIFNKNRELEPGKYYFNKITSPSYDLLKENFDNEKKKENLEGENNEDIDKFLEEEDDDEDDSEETTTTTAKLKNAHTTQKALWKLNTTTKMLKETLEGLEPVLNKGTDIMEKLKGFNLSQFL